MQVKMESCAKMMDDPLESQKQHLILGRSHLNTRPFMVLFCCLALLNYLIPIISPSPFLGHIFILLLAAAVVSGAAITIVAAPKPEVYMVDFECYTPPTTCRVPRATFMEHISTMGIFNASGIHSMERMLEASGQGETTCLPRALFYLPPRTHHAESVEEARELLFTAMEALLCRTGIGARQVDILIVNCSGMCTSPSLSGMVVNRFGMREDVKAFSLSGMGCSASLIAIDMAANLLKVHKNSNAVILSTEILTTGWYTGKEHNKLSLNCLFRTGSAAILLTNTKQGSLISKYKLILTKRRQLASDDTAYHSAFREEDEEGITGVTLTRDILPLAAQAVKMSVIDLAKSVLPWSEMIKYIVFKGYVPSLKKVVGHFCLPTSGRRFIREVGKGLGLPEEDTEAAMATLHRFGNQSSSGLWYELAYLEAKGRVKEGDKVWQLGMGSGVKTATALWECVRPISKEPNIGPWADCIHDYPNLAFQF